MSSIPFDPGLAVRPAASAAAAADAEAGAAEFPAAHMWPIRAELLLGLVALAVGGLIGLLQAIDRVDINLYPYTRPVIDNYYQGLTLHGVLLALVMTFAFANSFLTLTTMKGFQRPMASALLGQGVFWLGAAGVVLAGFAMLTNQANVLYTMYAPMTAHFAFYLGAVLLVVSTWLVSLNQLLTLRLWRREHPGERIPLLAYASIFTFIMWDLASIGIAVEALAQLLPMSAGLINSVNPQLTRTLFWFTGHAIVYFWLLPAYVSWYCMLPKQVGSKIYSDGLSRFVFVLFLLFSVPTGLHHQYTDPGVPVWLKTAHFFTTLVIALPSLITAFTMMAMLEMGGRANGGTGFLGWIPKLRWSDPSVTAQLLAMLTFILGGITGIVNASYTVNQVVHNTAFIPGHFHITVGTAVTLTIMGVCFWLVPYLTGKALWQPKLGLLSVWLYTIGVLTFSRGQMWGGIDGIPRRSEIGAAGYVDGYIAGMDWTLSNQLTAIGGVVMTVGGGLFLLTLIMTVFNSQRAHVEMPVAETVLGPRESWRGLDSVGKWTVLAFLLIVLAYGPTFFTLLRNGGSASPIPMIAMGYQANVPPGMDNILLLAYIAIVIGAFGAFWKLLQRNVR
ncbi:MAG: cbb3-type cytochrome c oxidase subunit I [Chloroflexota bacterium]